MAEPFKNMYNEQFFDLFTKDLKLVIDDFDAHGFVSQVMDDEWEGRELKQRCIHITTILKKFLPADYKEAIAKILELLDHVKSTRPDFSVIDDTKFGLMLEYGAIPVLIIIHLPLPYAYGTIPTLPPAHRPKL